MYTLSENCHIIYSDITSKRTLLQVTLHLNRFSFILVMTSSHCCYQICTYNNFTYTKVYQIMSHKCLSRAKFKGMPCKKGQKSKPSVKPPFSHYLCNLYCKHDLQIPPQGIIYKAYKVMMHCFTLMQSRVNRFLMFIKPSCTFLFMFYCVHSQKHDIACAFIID